MCKTKNRILLQTNDLVGSVHDQILDDNKLDLADAYDDACVWIAELHMEVERLKGKVSSGFIRTDTTEITKARRETFRAIDGGDAWIQTGRIA